MQPALARLAGALEVKGLAVARADGFVVASEGAGAASAWIEAIPLVADGEVLGELRVGATPITALTNTWATNLPDQRLQLNLSGSPPRMSPRPSVRDAARMSRSNG